MAHHYRNLILVCAFLAAIFLPGVEQTFKFTGPGHIAENRQLTPFPNHVSGYRDVKNFPSRFNAWYDDNFGFRRQLVFINNNIANTLLRSSDKVLFGYANWLFLSRGIRKDIEPIPIAMDLCGYAPMPAWILKRWHDAIMNNQRQAAARGILYLLAIVPNKHTLHRKFLPDRFQCDSTNTRRHQLVNAFRDTPVSPLIDLTPVLNSAYDQNTALYRQTDTHWNALAQLVAYEHLVTRAESAVAVPLNIGRHRIAIYTDVKAGGDLALMAGYPRDYRDMSWYSAIHNPRAERTEHRFGDLGDDFGRRPEAWRIPDGGDSSLIMFHDSFADREYRALFAESFGESSFIWWGKPALDFSLVDSVKPDVIIQQMVERNLLHPYFVGSTDN